MKIKDYFLSQEEFEIIETEIQGIYKTSPLPDDLGKYYESKNFIMLNANIRFTFLWS